MILTSFDNVHTTLHLVVEVSLDKMEHPDLHKSVNCEVYVVTFFRRLTFQSLLLRFAVDQFVPSGFSEYFPSKTFI